MSGVSANGEYTIDPDGDGVIAPLQVFCDMESDGGGWTLVLKALTTGKSHQTTGGVNEPNLVRPDLDGVAKFPDEVIASLQVATGVDTELRIQKGTATLFELTIFTRHMGTWSFAPSASFPVMIEAKTLEAASYQSGGQCHDAPCGAEHFCLGYPGISGTSVSDFNNNGLDNACIQRTGDNGFFFQKGSQQVGLNTVDSARVWVR